MSGWISPVGRAVLGLALAATAGRAQVVGPSTGGATALAQAERMLGRTKRVLMIAAHPDDEDTELLTYLVRREGAEAAYLSLTRGEGGQNLVGPELGDALGLIRSEELVAARVLDGARQYFTRAFDFGFSKTIDEAFSLWPRDTVLKDVVRVIRRFRPQLVVTIFSGTPRDGHGQHQVAGWAAREGFRVAGDPAVFPELLREEGLRSWTPLKLYQSARFDSTGANLVLEGGVLDPEVGQSVRQIAMRSRSLHRSQDMGMLQEIGPSPIRLVLERDRTGAGPSLFAGVDTAAPPPGADGIEARDQARHRSDAAAIRAGLVVDAIADESRLVAGHLVQARLSVWNSGARPATAVIGLEAPPGWTTSRESCLGTELSVAPGAVVHCRVGLTVASDAPISTPYFLADPRAGAVYRWSGDPALRGEPFDPPLVRARFELRTPDGSTVSLDREVQHRIRDQAVGEARRPLAVVPRVDVKVTPEVAVWSTGRAEAQPVTVTLQHAGRDSTTGWVHLDLPPGWPAVAPVPIELTRADERRSVSFSVRAPAALAPGTYTLRAYARDGDGRRYDAGQVVLSYPHLRERTYAKPSSMLVHAASLELPRARRIGYVRGASDLVPEALAAVGLRVDLLAPGDLERGELGGYDVIVIGSRAYETDPAVGENNGRLLDYVRAGGHLLVQYQQQPFFQGRFAPYPLSVAPRHDRVTDERAPVSILAPDDPVFRAPNRIGASDWDGWVQERGLYFARSWDPRYRPLIETHDPDGAPLEGGLLLASVGKGTYIYSGLAFFRQLPGGVAGAFRLFLNLLNVGPRAALP